MSEVVLLHHIQGLTPGVVAFADRIRAAGHVVHTPDLFDGRTFATIGEGQAFTGVLGWEGWLERGVAAADALPPEVVYAGISFGVTSAQRLAQTRPAARGAVLLESFMAPEWFGPWQTDVPVQVHGKQDDPFFAGDGELGAARQFAETRSNVEVFTYPGAAHLFVDETLPSYDAAATDLVLERILALLTRV
ncbi:MAG: dienelactone hydrolase family protein [Actinobacteria bacterium]|nr:dienelactone hydrolase family protein [Actinomycetota bacterium]